MRVGRSVSYPYLVSRVSSTQSLWRRDMRARREAIRPLEISLQRFGGIFLSENCCRKNAAFGVETPDFGKLKS